MTLAIVFGLLGVVAARPALRRLARHPSEERCAAMLDRYAEQQAQGIDPSRRAEARAEPPSASEVARCRHDLTADEVDCALRSNTADELERCLP